VQLHHWQGVATLPVLIDGGTHVEFVLDSGASTVQIPEDVFARMQANGATPPVIGQITSHIANGSSFQSRVIRLDAVQIGGVTVTNVLCTIAPRGSPPLLGQTVLQKFPNWSVDNQRGVFRWGP
jgi:predicted aspartyl protease